MDPNNAPHVGGNTWAGGTGGRDTAGLGGKGGPYRLDAGHDVHQLSDAEKDAVPDEVKKAAREMGRRAFKQRWAYCLVAIRTHIDADDILGKMPLVISCLGEFKKIITPV